MIKKTAEMSLNEKINYYFDVSSDKEELRKDILKIINTHVSVLILPLKMWGNSYVLKVPPQIAKLYELGEEIKVTIQKTTCH